MEVKVVSHFSFSSSGGEFSNIMKPLDKVTVLLRQAKLSRLELPKSEAKNRPKRELSLKDFMFFHSFVGLAVIVLLLLSELKMAICL